MIEDDEELAIGIDLGTTYSCMAVVRNNNIEIIPNEMGVNITPSIVSFVDNGILVGEQTIDQLLINPKKTIYSIKRLIGRLYNDKEVLNDINSNFWTFDIEKKNNRPIIKINNKNKIDYYYPEEISKYILEKLIQSANKYLNQEVTKAVITVPAHFNNSQKEATKLAAEQAGLEVLRIINEPTAASLAYGLDQKYKKNFLKTNYNINNKIIENEEDDDDDEEEKYILVFDLGGGTFDVTLLKIIDKEEFFVEATAGDSHLGGDDFDKKIIDYCLNEYTSKFNIDINKIKADKIAMNRLKIASEKAKIKLSYEKEAIIELNEFYKKELLYIKLTRETFENICEDIFQRLTVTIKKVIDDAKIEYTKIKELFLLVDQLEFQN